MVVTLSFPLPFSPLVLIQFSLPALPKLGLALDLDLEQGWAGGSDKKDANAITRCPNGPQLGRTDGRTDGLALLFQRTWLAPKWESVRVNCKL